MKMKISKQKMMSLLNRMKIIQKTKKTKTKKSRNAVLMFLASSLNIQLRKSDYAGLAVICSCLGLAAACWFATGLLGITLLDMAKIWGNIKDVMIEVMSQTPPEWPMMMT